ncbi:MAG TPA: aldolase/citrate lyase family protein [Ornithinimicrobium sp.]|uniref:HpcH/HpaI aldolase family protein n=1 Tax=Ornithinimicrobium sp. TaxID=1977084 RepID=UPI002B46FF6B|nr:aldolase/citrate lyase family protein [Ornithinimicrobium sp.]HKJ10951.1 aldolase/citrate lyase family protein [Ornithinimicrobium sp.]
MVGDPVQDSRATLQASAEGMGDGLRRGLWVTFLDPYGLEVAAGCGADWLGVDLQHGTVEMPELPGLLRVAEAARLPMLARVGSHDSLALGRVLDTGVSGVIIPMVDSADQARALVAACRTPPDGTRSTGACRAALGLSQASEVPLVFLMIETAAGLQRAADILAVPGADGVFFGPYDFSISAGHPGPGSPGTIEALRHVISLARAAGKLAGFMAGQPELLAVAPEADLVAVDTDVSALRLGLARVFEPDT